MKVLYEIFSEMPQQGPGEDDQTDKAFDLLTDLPVKPEILDIGCGMGRQTLRLASKSDCQITAVDNYQFFLDTLSKNAQSSGLDSKIKTLNVSMDDLNLPEESFDLVWSEGAIYIMGFENGLAYWKKFIKPGGYLVITEAAWFTDNPPDEVKAFWDKEYPGIKTEQEHLNIIRNAGYKIIDHFRLPESSWEDNYYKPLDEIVKKYRAKYAGDAESSELINYVQAEIDIYRNYPGSFGYVFYIMKK